MIVLITVALLYVRPNQQAIWLTIAILLVVLILVIKLPRLFISRLRIEDQKERFELENKFRATLLQSLGLVGIVSIPFTLFFSWQP